ncbi:MAG: hypothetical protein JWM64_243 [Frankiales bacterium]|nr:hypothetical protein [Frankiales bacterium]
MPRCPRTPKDPRQLAAEQRIRAQKAERLALGEVAHDVVLAHRRRESSRRRLAAALARRTPAAPTHQPDLFQEDAA